MNSGSSIELDFSAFSQIGYGGTGIVFKGTLDDKVYLVKVLTTNHDIDVIFRRVKNIRESFSGRTIPSSFNKRTLPIGQGIIHSRDLGKSFDDLSRSYPFLVFNYIDGIDLEQYLKDEEPCSIKRCRILDKVLSLLKALEISGVVHYDLYPDNFLVDSRGTVFLIDVESAGFVRDGKWQWEPLVEGKTGIFCIPPDATNGTTHGLYFDRWNAMYLVFFILFKKHPFEFLNRCDVEALKELISNALPASTWPPSLKNDNSFNKYLKEPGAIQAMKEELVGFIGSDLTLLATLLHECFIKGYLKPESRPDIMKIRKAMELITANIISKRKGASKTKKKA